MSMAAVIIGLSLLVFGGLLVWAAVADLRRYTIPNRVSLAILGAYLVYAASAVMLPSLYPSVNWLGGLIVGIAVLAVAAFLFAKGLLGGGDAKLLASTSVWAGPAMVFELVAITALAGGILALGVVAYRAVVKPAAAGTGETPAAPALPYGLAIAVGGLYVAARLGTVWADVYRMI